MVAGFQVWDASGNLIFDTAMRSGRIFGQVNILAGTPSGSVTDAHFAGQTPFYTLFTTTAAPQPSVTFAGNVMSWAKNAKGAGWFGTLFYGAY